MSLNFDVTSSPKLLNPQKKMIPLERASQDLGRSTILIMKIQKGAHKLRLFGGKFSSNISTSKWPAGSACYTPLIPSYTCINMRTSLRTG